MSFNKEELETLIGKDYKVDMLLNNKVERLLVVDALEKHRDSRILINSIITCVAHDLVRSDPDAKFDRVLLNIMNIINWKKSEYYDGYVWSDT